MTKFKTGDKLKCISVPNLSVLTLNKIYNCVASYGLDDVARCTVIADDGQKQTFFEHRFELVKYAPTYVGVYRITGKEDFCEHPLPEGTKIYLTHQNRWSDIDSNDIKVAGAIIANNLKYWTGCSIKFPDSNPTKLDSISNKNATDPFAELANELSIVKSQLESHIFFDTEAQWLNLAKRVTALEQAAGAERLKTENKPKRSMLKTITMYPFKWAFNKVAVVTTAGIIGYTYLNGLSLPIPQSKVTHSVVSYDTLAKVLTVAEFGVQKEYARTDNGWFSVDGFEPIKSEFLDRVAICLDSGVIGPSVNYPTQKSWGF